VPVGRHPEVWGGEEESGRTLDSHWQLFRRLRGQQAKALKLVKSENDLFASVAHFQATQASQPRKATDFCHWEAQQDGGAVLPNWFLDIHAHSWSHYFHRVRKHAARQTASQLSLVLSMRKSSGGTGFAQCAYFLTQTVQEFGTVCA
jgi:hypothetical protein